MARRMLLAAAGISVIANLISGGAVAEKIFVHTGVTSTISTSFALPATAIRGLTFDGANLISSDVNADKIFVHTGVTSTISTSFASPDMNPRGLTIQT